MPDISRLPSLLAPPHDPSAPDEPTAGDGVDAALHRDAPVVADEAPEAGTRADADVLLRRYLREIAPLPTLSRAEEVALAQDLERETNAWATAVRSIPFTARFALAEWRTIREEGRVTATLSASHRDGSGRDYSDAIDRGMARIERALARFDAAGSSRDADERAKIPALRRALARACDAVGLSLERTREAHLRLVRFAADLDAAPPGGARAALERTVGLSRRSLGEELSAIDATYARLAQAKNRFVRHNLKLVVAVAKDFRGMGIPFLDLIQEGNLGLIRAVEKFDHRRGFKFSTYAVWWIRQSFIRVVQNHSRTVRLPSHVYDLMLRYDRATRKLAGRIGRDPSVDELGAELGVDGDELDRLLEVRQKPLSMEALVPGTDSKRVRDALPDPRGVADAAAFDGTKLQSELEHLLGGLDGREQKVLIWRFGLRGEEDHTLQEIGEKLGISRERVRQIEAGALSKLRPAVAALGLRDLIEGAERGVAPGTWPHSVAAGTQG